jgi:hypothetical protein
MRNKQVRLGHVPEEAPRQSKCPYARFLFLFYYFRSSPKAGLMKAVAATGKFAEIPPCSCRDGGNRGVKQQIKTYPNEVAGIVLLDSTPVDVWHRFQAALTPEQWAKFEAGDHLQSGTGSGLSQR